MSGGHFDYAYAKVLNFALELKDALDFADQPNEYGETPYAFEPGTRAKLRQIEALALKTSALMREAEWLYSGDTSDESFMAHIAEIEADHQQDMLVSERLRTDDKAMAAFVLLHYGTPRKLADLLYEIHKGMDDAIFRPHTQTHLELAALWIDRQACEDAAAEARNARIDHMCDYEDRDNDR